MSHRPMKRNGVVVDDDGIRYWYLNGHLHRTDGPAIERPDGSSEWWQHGELHRDDGPAIVRPDGSTEWWKNGKQVEAAGR